MPSPLDARHHSVRLARLGQAGNVRKFEDEEFERVLTARSSRQERRAPLAGGGEERRSWLTNGLVGLVISGLGLGVAGAATLTGNAQSTDPLAAEAPRESHVAALPPVVSPRPPDPAPDPAPPAVARAFLRGVAAEAPSRSHELRTAVVQERAAQRAEDLSKTAEAVTRSSRAKSSAAREAELKATDRAIKAAAVRLAEQRRQRAEAARLAAERARARAEAALKSATAAASAATDEAPSAPSEPKASARRSEPEREPTAEPKAEPKSEPSPRESTTPSRSSGDEAPPPRDSGGSASPVPGAVIGSHFGQYGVWSRYHTGLDFRAGQGTPIKAVKSGVVLYAGNSGDWAGNHVAIKHGDGKTTMSSHMSSMAVSSGETVSAGQVIGYVGQTGRAFGAHLHFELYPAGVRYGDVYKAIDPQPWLSNNGVDTR